MYNILLTDDEQIVIDSLSFIINKNFAGQVNVFTALSGTKALEVATKEDIDIIFMDINMPGLTGLDTVSCILKLKPQVVIVILSAFDRFQYAQEAMNLGAFKYITKPVNRNVVIQTIRSAMDFVDERRGSQTAAAELTKKLDFVSPMIENDFIFACIFSKDDGEYAKSYQDYFGLDNKYWCVACFELKNVTSEKQHATYNQIRDLLNQVKRCIVSAFIMNMTVVMIPLGDGENDDDYVRELVKKFHSTLSFNVSSQIRVGVSSVVDELTDIKLGYAEASRALGRVSAEGGVSFANDDMGDGSASLDGGLAGAGGASGADGSSGTGGVSGALGVAGAGTYARSGSGARSGFGFGAAEDAELKRKLFIKVSQGDLEGTKNVATLYLKKIADEETDLNKVKNRFFEAIVTARNTTQEIAPNYVNNNFDDAFAVLNGEDDRKILCDYVTKTILEFTSAINNTREHAENPVVTKVSAYINEHLDQELSLEQMAEYAGVSSFYLSKIFKEEKGVNYIAFVTDRRLEMGQKLLKESTMSIKEITAAIGYNDQNYFSRLFKNKFGLSPSEFRK